MTKYIIINMYKPATIDNKFMNQSQHNLQLIQHFRLHHK